jgi:hypothetical protein
MSEKVVSAEAKGVVHKVRDHVAVASTFGLKVPRPTHETTSNRVVTASSSMLPEEEKRKGVYVARKEVPVPR